MPNPIDLGTLFKSVTGTLIESQSDLNREDVYNHDHGDNMVEIFKVITEAMESRPGADPADQLAYASELLGHRSQSGSAKLYAQGLNQASQQFTGRQVTPDNALGLVQTLLGGGQAGSAPASGDLLGSLLSGLADVPGQAGADQQDMMSGDLGSLLQGMLGGSQPEAEPGLDPGDLLNTGLAFLQAKQEGDGNLEALINAVVSSSQVGQSAYRAKSGSLVAKTLLQLVSS